LERTYFRLTIRLGWSIKTKRPDTRFTNNGSYFLSSLDINWEPAADLVNPTAIDPIALPNETTLYTVAVDNDGCIGTDTITIFVKQVIPVENLTESGHIAIYPNPVSDQLQLNFNLTTDPIQTIAYQLFDLNGQLIINGSFQLSNQRDKTQIDTSNIPPGEYFLELKGNGFTEVIELLKF